MVHRLPPIGSDVAQRQPDQLVRRVIGREMATRFDDLAEPGIHTLNRIGGVDHPPDLRFGELSAAGLNARLKGCNDTPRLIDDFRYSDHFPAGERERCNALIDTITRTAADAFASAVARFGRR